MKSIKEYNTTGMDLWEREKLFKEVSPIPLEEIVYRAGDAWDCTHAVNVNEKNQKEITMFWNSLYFDSEGKADRRTAAAHAEYGEYQGMAADICF